MDTDDYKDVQNPLLRYAMRQGITHVLLLLILFGAGYGLWWIMTVGVPTQLDLQRAERISFEKQREEDRKIWWERYTEERQRERLADIERIEKLISTFEKALDVKAQHITSQ